MISKDSSNYVLPPTGFMLTSRLLGREGGSYALASIQDGINRDYRFGNNCMRSVCAKSNGTSRDYGESEFLRTELDSIEQVREFAQRLGINLRKLSPKARKAINKGFEPLDQRYLHMKELDFSDEPNPLILFSKRRKSSLESKLLKTLERIGRYRDTELGRRDENFEMLKASYDRLEEDLGYDLVAWRTSQDTPFELCDTCATDFAGVTYVVSNLRLNSDGELEEITDKEYCRKLLDLVISNADTTSGLKFNYKDNFVSGKRDRALSFGTFNPKTLRCFESRLIFPRDIIEATIGNRVHDGYKLQQLRGIKERCESDKPYARLVDRAIQITNSRDIDDLGQK